MHVNLLTSLIKKRLNTTVLFWHGKLCQDQNGAKCAECQHVTSSKIHINIFDIKISRTKIAPLHSQVLTSTNVAPVKKSSS